MTTTKQREYHKNYLIKYNKIYLKTPISKFSAYKNRAKRKNIEFSLTFEEFSTFWQKSRYYCNNIIETIGIDRIDNNKGYQLDNIIPCCHTCNSMKSRMNQTNFINQCYIIGKLKQQFT